MPSPTPPEHPTRRDLLRSAGLGAAGLLLGRASARAARSGAGPEDTMPHDGLARPSRQQIAWQEAELSMFLHFGVNTFTDREWGEGTEDPGVFDPKRLDARQWASVAREAGFRYVILTAKHHDGFCLWPSHFTEHSVTRSPWRGGKGDVVREFSRACRDAGVQMGLYLSPWDRHEPTYGDSPAYNRHFRDQLTELLTDYGEVAEVWFDGACGEGPNGKKQEYDWPSYYETIRRLQPQALIAICGPDIRWVGNEDGFAHETEWSARPGDPAMHGTSREVWYPAECDVSIRPGWFWHAGEDSKVKPLEHLMDIYFRSVGRNSVLLLNVPPNRDGLLADPDVERLRAFRAERDRLLARDLARRRPARAESAAPAAPASAAVDGRPATHWSPAGNATTGWIEVDLGRPATFGVSMAQELIREGQRIEEYAVEALVDGAWREAARGTTVGHKKLDRFEPITASRVRLRVLRARAVPLVRSFGLYA